MNSFRKTLLIITIIGWLFVSSTFLFPVYTFSESFWLYMIFIISGLSCLSVLFFLISASINKNIWSASSILKKSAALLGIIFTTAIAALVALIAMFFIAIDRHPVSMSTYGTPLYRPKIK